MNGNGSSARLIPWSLTANQLDPDTLLSTVISKTGLSHLSDRQCEESLKALVHACNEEADFTLIGQMAARQYLAELLETRLRLLDLWRQVPEIQTQTVLPQIFITGLPKTASTFLHRLLACDLHNRVPRMWEVMHPLPPPDQADYFSDYRIKKAEKKLRWLRWIHADLASAHPVGALIPQECGSILGYSFQSRVFLDMFIIPSYQRWLETRDMRYAYDFHSKILKHLQWQCGGERWVLKSSDHLYSMESIVKVYPHARFLFLHRDPVRVLQAACSQMALLKSVFSRNVDLTRLGIYEVRCLSDKISLILETRRKDPDLESRIIDIRYLDLASDPVATVQLIYDRLGFRLSDEAKADMEAFAAAERYRDRTDTFRLADFNLSANRHSDLFDEYCERFAVEREEV